MLNYDNLEKMYGSLFADELDLEAEYKQMAEDLLRQSYEEHKITGKAIDTALGKHIMEHQFNTIYANINAFVNQQVTPRPGVKPVYQSIVQQLTNIYPNRRNLITMLILATFPILLNSVFIRECRLSDLSRLVSQEVESEARLEAFIQSRPDLASSVQCGLSERIAVHYKKFYARRRMEHAQYVWTKWDKTASTMLGAKLIELVMKGCSYFELYEPSDRHGKGVTEIRPTQWLLDTWTKNENNIIAKAYTHCPMIIPPAPWESFRDGGYYGDLSKYATLLRLHETNNVFAEQYWKRLDQQLELAEVKAAVNAIQSTPFFINRKILAVAKAIMERGGDIGGIPRMEPLPELPRLPGGSTPEEIEAHKKKCVEHYRLEARRKSKALRAIGNIKIAEKFAKYEKIYFPCNMDFRGRIYPIPTFSFQGDDLNKALLLFADVPECTSLEDIGWLMIHGANLAGVDKVSFEDRKAWVRDHEQQILSSAKDPLGYLWWAEQDEPFQFLAFCFEWAAWRDHAAKYGTPKGFKTGLPIAFDGTCSGLQHFSAILRDSSGASAVNLLPADKPQDIYSRVADIVNKQLQQDAITGTPDTTEEMDNGKLYTRLGTKSLAQQWLAYGVDRKVTKRSVMTLAYGSKEYGFKDQILEDTIDPAIVEGRGSMFVAPQQAARYMAKLIWNAVRQVVVKAVEGMEWLQKMAHLVTKEGQVVTWVTPMGLPVQQSYMQCKSEVFRMRFSGIDKRFYVFDTTGDIDKRAQAQGVAPNFIHSMDAAHLQLTVNMAYNRGIRHFAMIHDSYGTCLAHAGLMFRTVREAFVKMYTDNDVLQQFQHDMEMLIQHGDKIPKIPEKGNLDIHVVTDSLYAFH